MSTLARSSFPLLLVLGSTSCGGGGGGSQLQTPVGDLTGQWTITERITSANSVCAGEVGSVDTYTVAVAQTGNNLTVTAPAGTFSGTISGNQVRWTGSYPDEGGTTSITAMTLTVTLPTLAGSSNWSWTHPTDGSCTGTTQITGTKITDGGAGAFLLLEHDGMDDAILQGVWIAASGTGFASPVLAGTLGADGCTELELPAGAYDLRLLPLATCGAVETTVRQWTGLRLEAGRSTIVPVR